MATSKPSAVPLVEPRQRAALIADIEADLALEGLQLPAADRPLLDRFVAGEISADQLRAALLARLQSPPAGTAR